MKIRLLKDNFNNGDIKTNVNNFCKSLRGLKAKARMDKDKPLEVTVRVTPKDIFDDREITVFDKIKTSAMYKEVRFTVSRSFLDWHNIEERESNGFKKLLNKIKKDFEGISIKRRDNYWWVGFKDVKLTKDMEVREILQKIFYAGCGLGLVPNDITVNLNRGVSLDGRW